jgi:hypothetical protein
MKTLRWTWFILFLLFYSIPRIIYIIKFKLSDDSVSNSYEAYSNLAKAAEDVHNAKGWKI